MFFFVVVFIQSIPYVAGNSCKGVMALVPFFRTNPISFLFINIYIPGF